MALAVLPSAAIFRFCIDQVLSYNAFPIASCVVTVVLQKAPTILIGEDSADHFAIRQPLATRRKFPK